MNFRKLCWLLIFIFMSYCLFSLQTDDIRMNGTNNSIKSTEKQPERVKANPLRGTLLNDHFGVTPYLQLHSGGDGTHAFDWETLAPTLNTETATWVDCDWFGVRNSSDVRGTRPSGGEPYDVEALYFDNDDDYFYIAIITSVPHYWEWSLGNWDVGIVDPNFSNLRVRPGDISLSFFSGTGTNERYGVWHYNYGIDICHENRDVLSTYGNSFTTCDMRDNDLGTALYKTSANTTASAEGYDPPPGTSDWHVSTHTGSVEAGREYTNFDPSSPSNTSTITFIGDASNGMVVDYYNLTFGEGVLENGQETFVIEATIPRVLFGADDPAPGDSVGFRFTPGCRNDGNTGIAVAKLTTTVRAYCSIGDLVWNDYNSNGLQDELPLVGVQYATVNLYEQGGTTPIATMQTDANGNYLFDELLPGSYFVEFIADETWTISPQDVNTNTQDSIDSDADLTTGRTGIYTLVAGEVNLTVDCGIYGGDPLPVTLSTFTVAYYEGNPALSWITQSESENSFWNIYRSISQNLGQSVQINLEPVPGAGTTSEPTEYSYDDYDLNEYIYSNNLQNIRTYWYWLESVSFTGESELYGPIALTLPDDQFNPELPAIPESFGLFQNFPNPFNPITYIPYKISASSPVELSIYDIRGQKIKTLYNGYQNAGFYRIMWDGRDEQGNEVASGIYLYHLNTANEKFVKKMVLTQ